MTPQTDKGHDTDRGHANPDLDIYLEPVSQPEVTGPYESIQKTTDSSGFYNVEGNLHITLNPENDYEFVN